MKYQQWDFISGGPLFTHQYSHAWVDFRHQMDGDPSYIDYFENSQIATYAHRDFCISLKPTYADYGADMWGITASDSPIRLRSLGWTAGCRTNQWNTGALRRGRIADVLARDLPARAAADAQGLWRRIYQRYGFTDAFNPNWKDQKLWVNQDVIGIDVGISLLSIENLLTGNVWRWFMRNPYIAGAMDRVGFYYRHSGNRNSPDQTGGSFRPAPVTTNSGGNLPLTR